MKYQFGLAALLSIVFASSAYAQTYTYTDLGTLGGTHSQAYGINNVGQVVGYSTLAGDSAVHAFMTGANGSSMADIFSVYGGTAGSASGLNNAGQIAGQAGNSGSNVRYAVTTGAGGQGMYSLPALGGVTQDSGAKAVNDFGLIVGYSAVDYNSNGVIGSERHAVMWKNGIAQDLGTFDNSNHYLSSSALSVNSFGQIVGESDITYTVSGVPYGLIARHAALWSNDRIIDLGVLGGQYTNYSSPYSYATGINDSGQVVGYSSTDSNVQHAALWKNGGVIDLGTLGGNSSAASGINNIGQIVGAAATSSGAVHAVLWKNGVAVDLNSILDASTINAGWVLDGATAINDSGWIVGHATNSQTGEDHAFLLSISAVPEPESYVMALMSVGILGLIGRRSNRI